eukprot:828228-Rhodomonas_salina.1
MQNAVVGRTSMECFPACHCAVRPGWQQSVLTLHSIPDSKSPVSPRQAQCHQHNLHQHTDQSDRTLDPACLKVLNLLCLSKLNDELVERVNELIFVPQERDEL